MRDGSRRRRTWFEFLLYAVPVTLTTALLGACVFLVFPPKLESEMTARKKETMLALTDSAWSVLSYFHEQEVKGALIREKAQHEAAKQICAIRYGQEGKDYFWINDMHPRMVMHPYRKDLNGQDLSGYADPDGVFLFKEFVRVVEAEGAGYAEYKWQWKDEPDRVEPKLSYVQGFEPWGWIIGTGVYLTDVEAEMRSTKLKVVLAGTAFLLLGLGLSLFAFRQARIVQRERLATTKAMADQAEFLETLLAAIASPVYYKDTDGRYLGCNPAFEELTGISREELAGKTIWEVWPENYAANYLDRDQDLFESPGHQQYDSVVPTRDGGQRDVAFHKATFNNSSGSTAGIVGVLMDITERKRALAELDRTRSLLTAAVDQSPAGILIADAPDVRVWLANAAALEIRGMYEEEQAAPPLDQPQRWQVSSPDGIPLQPEELPLSRAIRKGEVSRDVEVVIHRPGGEKRIVSANAAPVRDPNGSIVAGVVVFTDITEQRDLEQQLRQAQKMEAIGQLAGGVAHDFNNLLQAIGGYAELAKHELPEGVRAREDLEEVEKAAARATVLVRQLLAFSRRESLQFQSVDVNNIVVGLMNMIGRLIGEHIDLGFRPGPDVPDIYADPGQVEQIILNLCVNARDAMPTGGKILIETGFVELDETYCTTHAEAQKGRFLRLTVSDTGCGIPPKNRDRVFEPFFSTKPAGEGTGLGLANVYAIAKRHNGFVNLYSEVGHGTVFRVYLPIAAKKPDLVQEDQKAEIQPRGKGETILLAEDEEQVREVGVRSLERAGYRVVSAKDGEEAIELFRENPDSFDLALLDVVMPKKSGRDVFEFIQAHRPGLPVILATGYSFNILDVGFLPEGDHILVQKPFVRADLLRTVREALRKDVEA